MIKLKPLESLFAKVWIFGFEFKESSKSVTIDEKVEFLKSFVTSKWIKESKITVPLNKESPTFLYTGIDSPVKLDSSKEAFPKLFFHQLELFHRF